MKPGNDNYAPKTNTGAKQAHYDCAYCGMKFSSESKKDSHENICPHRKVQKIK